jgi:hypothetical protein
MAAAAMAARLGVLAALYARGQMKADWGRCWQNAKLGRLL